MARLALPSLTDELLYSEDEDTSGAADTDPKQRQATLTISIKRNGVYLTQGGKLMQPFWESTTEPSQRRADGVYSGLTIRITFLNIRLVQVGVLEASL